MRGGGREIRAGKIRRMVLERIPEDKKLLRAKFCQAFAHGNVMPREIFDCLPGRDERIKMGEAGDVWGQIFAFLDSRGKARVKISSPNA